MGRIPTSTAFRSLKVQPPFILCSAETFAVLSPQFPHMQNPSFLSFKLSSSTTNETQTVNV